jgi:flagellar M-ring protein FliF
LAFPTRPAPQAWWRQSDNLIDYGKWIFYLVVGLVGFFYVIRPTMKILQVRLALPPVPVVTPPTPEALAAAKAGAAKAALARPAAAGGATPVSPLLDDYDLPPPGSPVDVMVDHLKVLAAKEPERVAEVVKQWVQKDARA